MHIICRGCGVKNFQFIAQTQKDMMSWIEAINCSSSKSSSPEIVLSPSPICFKQELLPNRELPVPPAVEEIVQDYCYDMPNPIIRPVNVYENAMDEVDMESIYHFIDESKLEKDILQKVAISIIIITIIVKIDNIKIIRHYRFLSSNRAFVVILA